MLTYNDITLVRTSFALIVPIQDAAADLFYDRLFTIAPKLRELFPADLREQKRKLMQMIAAAVGGLNNLDNLVPKVKALGARHSGYGVTAAHYGIVGETLLWTLEQGLREHCTPEIRSAWAKVYGALSATMQAGAAEVVNCVQRSDPTDPGQKSPARVAMKNCAQCRGKLGLGFRARSLSDGPLARARLAVRTSH